MFRLDLLTTLSQHTQAVAEQSDEDPEVDAGGNVVIPESIKAVGPFIADIPLEVCDSSLLPLCAAKVAS